MMADALTQLQRCHRLPIGRQTLEELKASAALVDGELVAIDEQGRPSFQTSSSDRAGRRFLRVRALLITGAISVCAIQPSTDFDTRVRQTGPGRFDAARRAPAVN